VHPAKSQTADPIFKKFAIHTLQPYLATFRFDFRYLKGRNYTPLKFITSNFIYTLGCFARNRFPVLWLIFSCDYGYLYLPFVEKPFNVAFLEPEPGIEVAS